jgi:hypothetical protein
VGLGPNQPAIKAPPPPGAETNPGNFPQGASGGAPAALAGAIGVAPLQQGAMLPPPKPMFPAVQAAQPPVYYQQPSAVPPVQTFPQAGQAAQATQAAAPAAGAKSGGGKVIGRIGAASPAQLAEAKKAREARDAEAKREASLAAEIAASQPAAAPQVAPAAPQGGGLVAPALSGAFLPLEVVHADQRAKGEPLAQPDGAHVPIVGPSQSSDNGLKFEMRKDEKGRTVVVDVKREGPIVKLPQPPINAPPPVPPPPPSRLVDAHGRRLGG